MALITTRPSRTYETSELGARRSFGHVLDDQDGRLVLGRKTIPTAHRIHSMPEWTPEDSERARAWRDRPEWERRGALMNDLEQAGGRVTRAEWRRMGRQYYPSGVPTRGFLSGTPPVISEDGDDIVIRERGRDAARYWRERYGPQA